MKIRIKLYGGDAQNLGQLDSGDILTDELIHEGCNLVWDGKGKITIQLPIVQVKKLQKTTFLNPKLFLFTKKRSRMLGINIAKIKIVNPAILKTKDIFDNDLEYTITTITCGKNRCEIYTTID